MVQLKELYYKIRKQNRPVSIPNGSIKSSVSIFWKLNTSLVSIPNGSIKSDEAIKEWESILEFQFLMVQLKENFVILSV